MIIKRTITSTSPTTWAAQPSSADLELAVKILTANLAYQTTNSVLIVTDQTYIDHEASIWFTAAQQLPGIGSITLIELEGMIRHGQVPPEEVIERAKIADITLLHTTYSLTHTSAATAGRQNNGRVASMPGLNYEMMTRTLSTDFTEIAERGERLKKILETGTTLTITAGNGTNLSTTIRQTAVYNDSGLIVPGEVGNLPGGEVFFAPPETSTNGVWVIDAALANEPELDQPVILEIVNGVVTAIKGGAAAQRLQAKLDSVGPLAYTVAEIGIGTNPTANPYGDLLEAEKALGTAHLAVGANAFIGGSVNIPIHLDGVTMNPTITVDNQVIMSSGTLLL